jgi:hypothetical protein
VKGTFDEARSDPDFVVEFECLVAEARALL